MSNFTRPSGRKADELRLYKITPNFTCHAEGSVLIQTGRTQVICTASVEERVPPFLKGKGQGWLTAEYGMLPRATLTRTQRESTAGKAGGRTHEIQRLIGRSLRSIINLNKIGERTIHLDCDVIQADGGTRTASISGAYVALHLALTKMQANRQIKEWPLSDSVAAVSCGIYKDHAVLDMDYVEDADSEVDFNIVMTGKELLVEVQGTAEGHPFSEAQMQEMLALGKSGIQTIMRIQKQALA